MTNPNFNYTDKALSVSVSSMVTDKLTKNGYKSSKTGFGFGTSFEQYEDLYISPNLSSYVEKLETNSSAIASLKKQEHIAPERLGITKFRYLQQL